MLKGVAATPPTGSTAAFALSGRRVGPPPARLRACALVSPTPPQGGSDSLLGGLAFGNAALNSPLTRLGWRRTHTTPGFCLRFQEAAAFVAKRGFPRPTSGSPARRHEAAATLLYQDGLYETLSQVTHGNRRIRGSHVTHDAAGGQDFQSTIPSRPLPNSA